MAATEVPFSELIQQPRKVTDELASGRWRFIRLRRRDAEDLVIMPMSRLDAETDAMGAVTRLLALVVRMDSGASAIELALPDVFPWVRFLSAEGQRSFALELIDTARASIDVGTLAPLETVIVAWRNTAAALADPELRHMLMRELPGDDLGPVPYPGEEE